MGFSWAMAFAYQKRGVEERRAVAAGAMRAGSARGWPQARGRRFASQGEGVADFRAQHHAPTRAASRDKEM